MNDLYYRPNVLSFNYCKVLMSNVKNDATNK